MNVVSDDVLEKLLCTACEKYLNVPPIKVYGNRSVKCGRCATKDDLGVESSLFNLIADNLKYPCVNRLEGCSVLLDLNEVEKHEFHCVGYEQQCPFCPDFAGVLYYLEKHLKRNHKENKLNSAMFFINLDQGHQSARFWYRKPHFIAILLYYYDPFDNKVTLEAGIIGNIIYKHTTKRFLLTSLNNVVIYQTKPKLCSSSLNSNAFLIKINPENYLNNILVCKCVFEEPILEINALKRTILDPMINCALVKCTFANVSGKLYRYDDKIYAKLGDNEIITLSNTPWKIYALVNNNYCLQFGLECVKPGTYCISVKYTLLSSLENGDKTFSLLSQDYTVSNDEKTVCKYNTPLYIKYVRQGDDGFLMDNALKAEVQLYVSPKNDVEKCSFCLKKCNCKKE